jgi:hypothetical protein
MTLKSVATGIGALTVIFAASSPIYAQVSNDVRRACEAQADQVRPYLRTPEREQFIANCLANATTTQGNNKKKKY